MYPCAASGFGHGRNQWRSCILRVLAWPRNKKSRGEWDETQNLEVCLLLALLLTACGGQNREPENPPAAKPSAPGEEAAEPPDETPEPEPAKPEEKEPLSLEDVLTDIYTVAPGTAGSSLRATYAAGELLDWIDVNSVEQEDVFRWIDENVPMENSAELARAWAAVLTEAETLMRGDETAYDALDDAGYTMEQPYRSTGRVK